MKVAFYIHSIKTHFLLKHFLPGVVCKLRVFELGNGLSILLSFYNILIVMLLSILNQEEMARLQENLEKLKAQGSEDDSEEKVNRKSNHSRPTLELTLLTPRVVVRRIPFACNLVIGCS